VTIVKNFSLRETFGSPAWLLDRAVRFERAASGGCHPRNRPIVGYVRFLRCLNLREAPGELWTVPEYFFHIVS